MSTNALAINRWRLKKKPVTLIVGIICKDGIVIGSDSQTTYGTSKQCDTRKVSVVEFQNAKALVAESGSAEIGSRAIEILKELAKDQPLADYRTVADLAQRAMRQIKDELRVQNCDCTMEELRDFLLRNDIGCELMLAHYFEGKPYI